LKFSCRAATWARKAGVSIPYEMWPTKPSEMARGMEPFLDPKGPFYLGLTEAERQELTRAEDHWPEYPLKIKKLAEKYGYKPPWQVLPDGPKGELRSLWDRYRVKGATKAAADLVPPNEVLMVANGNRLPALPESDALPVWRRLSARNAPVRPT